MLIRMRRASRRPDLRLNTSKGRTGRLPFRHPAICGGMGEPGDLPATQRYEAEWAIPIMFRRRFHIRARDRGLLAIAMCGLRGIYVNPAYRILAAASPLSRRPIRICDARRNHYAV